MGGGWDVEARVGTQCRLRFARGDLERLDLQVQTKVLPVDAPSAG